MTALKDLVFSESQGELYLILDLDGRAYKGHSFTSKTIMTSNYRDADLFRSEDQALNKINGFRDRLPQEFKVVQVKEVMKVAICVTAVVSGLPHLKIEKLWVEKDADLTEKNYTGMYDNKEEAQKFLDHWKVEIVRFYQDEMVKISRLKI